VSWLADLFLGPDVPDDPPMPSRVWLDDTHRVVAYQDRIQVWDAHGAHLATHRVTTPWFTVFDGLLIDGAGGARDLATGALVWQGPLAGRPVVWNDSLVVLGWHKVWWADRGGLELQRQDVPGLDVSPQARLLRQGDTLLVCDPMRDGPGRLDPASGEWVQGYADAPVMDGCLFQDALITVQDRGLRRWSADLQEFTWEHQPAKGQVVAVDAAEHLAWARRDQQGRLWVDLDGRATQVDEQTPNRVRLRWAGGVLAVETWRGVELLGHALERVEAPERRRKRRPLQAGFAVHDGHLLLAVHPPRVIDLATSRVTELAAP
jgi:hypothetical protein